MSQPPSERRPTLALESRRSQHRVAAALLAVVLLAAGVSIGLALTTIFGETSDAVLLDVAGRQRALNQLYLKRVLLRATGHEADLEAARDLFRASATALRDGGEVVLDPATGATEVLPAAADEELRRQIESGALGMERQLAAAEELLAGGIDDPAYEARLGALRELNGNVHDELETLVRMVEDRSRAKVARSLRWAVASAALMLLTGIGLFWQARRLERLNRLYLDEERRRDEATRHLDTVVESILDGLVTIDERGIVQSFNPAAESLFGHAADEIVGHNVALLMPEPERGQHQGYIERYLRTGQARIIGRSREVTGQRKDGTTFPMSLAVSEARSDGRAMFVGVVRDVTEEKRAAAALRRSEERFQLAVEGSAAGLWDWDLQRSAIWYSPRFKSLLGYREDEFPDTVEAVREHVHPEDRERAEAAFEAHFRERAPCDLEYRFRLKNGDYRWFRSRGQALWDDSGKPVRMAGSITDISDRRLAEEALRLSEERFQLAVAGSTDGLWDWDVVSGEVWYAPRFKEMLGYADDEFPNVFDSFEAHLHPDDHDATLARVAEHLEQRRPYDVEYRLRTKQGEWRWFRARGQALWNDAGEPYRMAGSISDITDRKRAQQQLARAKEQAEAANAAKSQFLANMSHELRTPLNAIIGYSELLEEEAGEGGDPSTIDDLRKIGRAGRHLLGLINDVLDLSKVEAGKMELDLERFDLAEMLEDTEATVRPMFAERGNSLELEGAETVGPVTLDRTRLRQVVLNLLSNANKFTDRGSVRLAARRQADDGRHWLVLTVMDNGIGMTPEQLTRIFEPFSQADGSTTRRHGGTGLGLTICRRLCELMGGSIEADSETGRGSTFTVRLPVSAAAATAPAAAGTELPSLVPDPGADTVLVIDDDPDVRELMSRLLIKEGFAVVTAADGEEGLEQARRTRPRVITLDVMMPVMDGWSVLTRLKEDEELRHIPVVLVTMIDDRSLGLALGAADYLIKPIDRRSLARTLGRYRSGAAPGTVLIVEDSEDVRTLVRRTLAREGWRVVEAADGVEALERIAEGPPDVVLLDLMMPRMDGFEFLDELRRRPEQRSLPVVVLTAKGLSRDERRRLSGSVERILQKGSYRREELLAEVARQVHRYARVGQDGEAAAS